MGIKNVIQICNKQFLSPGYLTPHLVTFIDKLIEQHFTSLTIRSYFDSVAHFGGWLQKRGIPIEDINWDVAASFASHRCNCPGGRKKHAVSRKYARRVDKFLIYLDHIGVIDIPSRSSKIVPPPLVVRFREHLCQRGLASASIDTYEDSILTLLPLLGANPRKYHAALIREVICNSALQHSRCKTKKLSTALRVYLRFLAIEGLCVTDLDASVPTVAEWRLSSIPRYITSTEVERTINSCDLHSYHGLRDQAIILLLARLGLRAGDVVNMCISDINWLEGSISVRGKGKTEDKLPLPQDVGDALLAYLKKARPPVKFDQVFVCLNAPSRPFSSSASISCIVSAALLRAGIINPPSHGAHLLRHSAATTLLRDGAALETVSSVLRHHSLNMTAYYAKVDIHMLMKIAQPWPGGASC